MAKAPTDLRSLARAQTAMGVRVLASIASEPEAPAAARVAAVIHLLDRGWGKPPTTHTGADGEGDIRVTIRHIIEGRDVTRDNVVPIDQHRQPAALIDVTPGEDDGP